MTTRSHSMSTSWPLIGHWSQSMSDNHRHHEITSSWHHMHRYNYTVTDTISRVILTDLCLRRCSWRRTEVQDIHKEVAGAGDLLAEGSGEHRGVSAARPGAGHGVGGRPAHRDWQAGGAGGELGGPGDEAGGQARGKHDRQRGDVGDARSSVAQGECHQLIQHLCGRHGQMSPLIFVVRALEDWASFLVLSTVWLLYITLGYSTSEAAAPAWGG